MTMKLPQMKSVKSSWSSVKGKLRALNTNIRKKRRQDINGLNFQCNKLEKSILKLKKIESWK